MLYDAVPTDNLAQRAQGSEALPAATGEVLAASAGEGFANAFPDWQIAQYESRNDIPTDPGEAFGQLLRGPHSADEPGVLSADDANKRYGIAGQLNFTTPVPESVARDQNEAKRAELFRADTIARREDGIGSGWLARTAAGLAGGAPGLLDPFNLAVGFMTGSPIGEYAAPFAEAATSTGERLAIKAATGAAQGAAFGAAAAPVQAIVAKSQGEDFTASDALSQILLGGVLGGGMHALFGHDPMAEAARPEEALAVDRADPAVREAAVRGAVAALVDGTAPLDMARLDWSPEFPPTEGVSPFERAPPEPQRLATFLRANGGLADEGGDISEIVGGKGSAGGLVNNASGQSLDDATHAAWEAGFLPGAERPEITTLLDALGQDYRGNPVYSDRDAPAAMAYREALGRNAELSELMARHNIPTEGYTRGQVADMLADRLSTDALAGELKSQSEAHEGALSEAEYRAREWFADHGHMEPPDFDPGRAASQEEMEDAWREADRAGEPAGAAGGLAAGAADGERPEPAAGNQGALQEGARQRRGGALAAGRDGAAERLARPELAAADRPELNALAGEIAELEAMTRGAVENGEVGAHEIAAANEAAADAEAEARACEQSGVCLGRAL
jgi:hypothetical protein